MAVHHDYIRSVLERFEGKGLTKGYVPSKNGVPLGVSGVTIGTGVDLGQQTSTGLVMMGVPPEVIRKLTPYFGLKKQAAMDALKRQPLTLSPAEVYALDSAVIGRYVRNIGDRYNRDTPFRAFADIPPQAQAVVVSVLYQRGLGYSSKATAWWHHMQSGDWVKAAAWLCDPANGGGYHSRRKAEGEILLKIKPTWADEVRAKAQKK